MAVVSPKSGKKADAAKAKSRDAAKGAKSKAKKEAPAKTKKAKKTGQGPGIKQLVGEHADKLVLGLAGILALLIIAWGLRSNVDRINPPQTLAQAVEQAQSHINRDTWASVLAERRPQSDQFHAIAESNLQPITPTMYAMVHSWNSPLLPNEQRRADPEWLPVQQLIADAGSGPLLIGDPMTGGYDGYYAPGARRRAQEGDEFDEFDFPEEVGTAMLDPDSQPLPPGLAAALGGAGMAGENEVKGVHFVALRGAIPWKEQARQYREAFEEAAGLNPMRDTPKYLFCVIERAEVDAAGQPTEWVKVGGFNQQEFRRMVQEERWAMSMTGMQDEPGDPRYLDPNTVMPLPPLVNRDLNSVALHPLIPRASTRSAYGGYGGYGGYGSGYGDAEAGAIVPGMDEQQRPQRSSSPDRPRLAPADALGSTTGGYGSGYGYGYGAASDGGYPQAGAGPVVAPSGGGYGYGYGGARSDASGAPPSSYGSGYGGYGDADVGTGGYGYGYGSGDSYGAAGYSSYGYGAAGLGMGPATTIPMPPVDYKLFRYFDFGVEPGKAYRYRVQLWLEDPNDPMFAQAKPKPYQLEDEVTRRISQKQKPATYFDPEKYCVTTPWSDSSQVVYVSQGTRVLVGKVEPAARAPAGPIVTAVPGSYPKLTAIIVDWDPVTGQEVPAEATLKLGSVAQMRVDEPRAVVYDNPSLKKLDNYRIKSDLMIADIRGGEALPGRSSRDRLSAPGEILLMDSSGQLFVRDELDDMNAYQVFDLPEPGEEQPGYDGYGGYGDEAYGGGGASDRASRLRNRGRSSGRGAGLDGG